MARWGATLGGMASALTIDGYGEGQGASLGSGAGGRAPKPPRHAHPAATAGHGKPAPADARGFGLCSLLVHNIPKDFDSEESLRKLFAARLNAHAFGGSSHRYVQSTIRKQSSATREEQLPDGTWHDTDEVVPARSWALVTFSDELAVKMVLSKPMKAGDNLLQMDPVDPTKAESSTGEFQRVYAEAQDKAKIDLQKAASKHARSISARLGSTMSRRRMQTSRDLRARSLTGAAATVRETGWCTRPATADVTPRAPKAPLSEFVRQPPRAQTAPGGRKRAQSAWRKAAVATQVNMTWHRDFLEEPPKAVPRPGQELPAHWPTSPRSRQRFTRAKSSVLMQTSRQAQADRLRNEMRNARLKRQRDATMSVYKRAFHAIDVDKSNRVDPNEIVQFVSNQGKRVDTRRFWRIFAEIDVDNTGDLDFDEFIRIMDLMEADAGGEELHGDSARAEVDPHSPIAGAASAANATLDATSRAGQGATHSPGPWGGLGVPAPVVAAPSNNNSPRHPTENGNGNGNGSGDTKELGTLPEKTPKPPQGTEILNGMIEQHRELADIYTSLTRMRAGVSSTALDLDSCGGPCLWLLY